MKEQTAAEPWQTPDAAACARGLGHRVEWAEWTERTVLLLLILVFVVTGFIPAWRHLNSDFPNYYLIARLYRKGYPLERVYEWTWLQRQKDHEGIDQPLVSFIPSTLPSALIVLPWSSLPPLHAKRWWLLVNLAFLLLIGLLLATLTKLHPMRIALLLFLATVPLRNSFLFGQMHILVLLLLTLAACLYFRDRFFLSGLVLAVAASVKIYPALFLFFFVFKKQWRAVIGLTVGVLGAGMLSLYLFGTDACRLYVSEVLPRGLRGETIDPYSTAWNSLGALLRRLFVAEPELNPAPVVHAPSLYAFLYALISGLIFVAFMWAIGSKPARNDRRKLEWATYLFLLFLLSSQPGSYHFVALILTAVLVVDYLLARRQTFRVAAVVVLYALICGPLIQLHSIQAKGWSNLLFFPRLTLMLLLGGVLLWILVDLSPGSLASRFNRKTSMLASSALIALVVVGFISNTRHLSGQFDNYKTRLATTPDSLFASDPAVTSRAVLFTAMVKEGYEVRRLSTGSVKNLSDAGGDWFHPAAGQQADQAWAEQSLLGSSRIVRFSPWDSPRSSTTFMPGTENAEQPSVSPDGKLLAFVREENGRNGLWVRQMGTAGSLQVIGEREIAGPEYDVREMNFFPDHRLVFSSESKGRFALYVVDPSGSMEVMKVPGCSARYPAISPDGQWMAFSCEEHGSWQLHVMNLQTKQDLHLTNSACNSTNAAWRSDSRKLVYATDCGRGLGLTALAELTAFQ
jgi:Glycosyltransferase family 87/WD40-like Beta Propeller Repeat